MKTLFTILDVQNHIKTIAHREKLTDLRRFRGLLADMDYYIGINNAFYFAFYEDKTAHATYDAELFGAWQTEKNNGGNCHGNIKRLISVEYANSEYHVEIF